MRSAANRVDFGGGMGVHRTDASPETDAKVEPLGEKATEVTKTMCALGTRVMAASVSDASATTEPSAPPAATRRPLGGDSARLVSGSRSARLHATRRQSSTRQTATRASPLTFAPTNTRLRPPARVNLTPLYVTLLPAGAPQPLSQVKRSKPSGRTRHTHAPPEEVTRSLPVVTRSDPSGLKSASESASGCAPATSAMHSSFGHVITRRRPSSAPSASRVPSVLKTRHLVSDSLASDGGVSWATSSHAAAPSAAVVTRARNICSLVLNATTSVLRSGWSASLCGVETVRAQNQPQAHPHVP